MLNYQRVDDYRWGCFWMTVPQKKIRRKKKTVTHCQGDPTLENPGKFLSTD